MVEMISEIFKGVQYIKVCDCQFNKINKANSTDLLIDMFKVEEDLNVWKSESNVLTNLVTQTHNVYR